MCYHFISTHTPLAGRDRVQQILQNMQDISTHTPLAGRDDLKPAIPATVEDFYSHAPRGT